MKALAVLICVTVGSTAHAQQGSEIAVDPGKAFVAFQQRAWELSEGRVRVFSDIQQDDAAATLQRIQSILQAIDQVFDGMRPLRQTGELQVWLLKDRNDYLSAIRMIANANGAHTGGMAMARGAETHVFVHGLNWSTIQHELWHAANSIFVPNLPTWLDEGIATIFEKGSFIGKQFVLGNAPTSWLAHARKLRADEAWVPLAVFVQNDEQWNDRVLAGDESGKNQYVEAWAITHFLLLGDNGAHRDRINTMLKRLHQGQNSATALRAGLGHTVKAVEALDENIGDFLSKALPTDMVATHQLLDTWARTHAREFPDEGRINPHALDTAMSLARWMIDSRHGVDKRNVRDKTKVKVGRRADPPFITINPIDGARWTITWEKNAEGFEPVIRWSLAQ